MEEAGLLYKILTYCPPPVILPIIASVFIYKKLPFFFRVFTLFLYSSLVVELSAYYLAFKGMNNLFLMHFFIIVEFGFLSYFYGNLLDNVLSKRFIRILIVSFTIFSLINTFFIENITDINSYSRIVEMSILFGFTLLYAYKSFFQISNDRSEESFFWINLGYLIYSLTSLVLLLVGDYILTDSKHRIDTWLVNFIFIIVLNIFVMVGYIQVRKFPVLKK